MQLAHFSQSGTEAPSPTGAPPTIETSKEIGNRSAFSGNLWGAAGMVGAGVYGAGSKMPTVL